MKKTNLVLTICLTLALCAVSLFAFSQSSLFRPADENVYDPPAMAAQTNPLPEPLTEAPTEALAEAPTETPDEIDEICVLLLSPSGSVKTVKTLPGLFKFPSCDYREEGKVFKGWRVEGDTLLYAEGDEILVTDDVVISAVFGKHEYKVTFYSDEGEKVITCEEQIKLPVGETTEVGLVFAGWSSRDGGPVVWKDGETIDVSGNMNLYAVFEKKTYTVSFHAGEGNGSISPETCRHGEKLCLPSEGFTKDKKNLKGFTDQNNNYYPIGSKAIVEGDMTFTAVYELNRSFKIRMNDTINYEALYVIDLREYIDLDSLVREGATQIRMTWTQTATATKGKCIPGVDVYCGEPKKNMNPYLFDHYEAATYTDHNRVCDIVFDLGTRSFSTKYIDLNQAVETGKIYIHYKALAVAPLDVANNEYHVEAVFTVEVN